MLTKERTCSNRWRSFNEDYLCYADIYGAYLVNAREIVRYRKNSIKGITSNLIDLATRLATELTA